MVRLTKSSSRLHPAFAWDSTLQQLNNDEELTTKVINTFKNSLQNIQKDLKKINSKANNIYLQLDRLLYLGLLFAKDIANYKKIGAR